MPDALYFSPGVQLMYSNGLPLLDTFATQAELTVSRNLFLWYLMVSSGWLAWSGFGTLLHALLVSSKPSAGDCPGMAS